jgi:hypothetical protein
MSLSATFSSLAEACWSNSAAGLNEKAGSASGTALGLRDGILRCLAGAEGVAGPSKGEVAAMAGGSDTDAMLTV